MRRPRRLVEALAADAGGAADNAGGGCPRGSRRDRAARRPRRTAARRSPCAAPCCVHVSGAAALDEERRAALPRDLRAAVDEPRVRVGAELVRLLREGLCAWRALAAGVALAAVGTVVEAVLFRALFDRGRGARSFRPLRRARCWRRCWRSSCRSPGGCAGPARRIEEQFRDLFMRKIPRLGDRYFQSRPVSDMAERAHLVHKLRALPALAGDILRTALEIVVIAIALVWLDPRGAAAGDRARGGDALRSRSRRAGRRRARSAHAQPRGRAGALLSRRAAGAGDDPDARRGARARARAPGSAARMGARGARRPARRAGGRGAAGAGRLWPRRVAARRLSSARAGGHDAGAGLLAVYWTLSLPMLGYELALFVQQVPGQRSLTLRLRRAARARPRSEDGEPALATALAASPDAGDAVAINLHDVHVVAGGHEILAVDALAIAPGEHVAIVGASGAGKSSLVGLLLGWHRSASGTVTVDGRRSDAAELEVLRQRTVWVDPSVYLWNRSLARQPRLRAATAARRRSRPRSPRPTSATCRGACRRARRRRSAKRAAWSRAARGSGSVSAAACCGRGPRLVILDEPFRGLAREQRARCWRARGGGGRTRRCCA